MHYHESKWMRFLNAVIEFVLITFAFIIAGLLRVESPIGSAFIMEDTWHFFPMAILYAVVMVASYALEGSYHSLHMRSKVKEIVRLLLADLIGFALMATLLYVFRMSQFSRLLLGYFYVISVLLIFVKRCVFEKIANAYIKKYHMNAQVLLVGSGALAKRFYEKVLSNHTASMECVGYLAEKPSNGIQGYLGNAEDLHSVLEQKKVDMIVVAQEVQSSLWLRQLMALATEYKIRVCVVPVYSDYVTARSEISTIGGLHMVDLSLLDTCNIMDVNIGVTDMVKTMTLLENQLEQWRGKYICVANVHTTVTAHDDEEYRKVQNGAVIALPDGGPLSAFSREHGFDGAQRVTGPDLMREVLAVSAEKGWRNYFYGSTEETLTELQAKIEERYPGAAIAGMYSPPFRDLTPQEDAEIVERINATHPDFVWVGLGAPKQERWMAAHEDRVNALMIGVGAAFDYEAGNIKRAPQWMQSHNLERLYRLLQDPKRLFGRYLTTNAKYLWWKWRQ